LKVKVKFLECEVIILIIGKFNLNAIFSSKKDVINRFGVGFIPTRENKGFKKFIKP